MLGTATEAWLHDWSHGDDVALRVLCLPPAGGGAQLYRRWPRLLPPHVGVVAAELPGRGTRLAERPVTDLAGIVEPLGAAVAPLLDRPLVIFGHSMGGTIGAELCRVLRRRTGQRPAMLVAAGCEPPHAAKKRDYSAWLTEDGIRRFLAEMGGTPPELLANEEYMGLLTPVLRADLTVLAGRRQEATAAELGCAVRAYRGRQDRSVHPDRVARWREASDGDFRLTTFPGGHFFVQESASHVLARLAQDLAHALARAGQPGRPTVVPAPAAK
jgi:surfactin synthase thioesterase subunit